MGQAECNETVVLAEEQQILFVPVPWAVGYTKRTILILFFFFIIAMPMILLIPTAASGNDFFAMVGCIFFIQIVFSYFYILKNQKLERKRIKSTNFGESNLTSDEFTEVLEVIERTISETKGGLAKDQLPSIKAIVDPLLQDEIQSIDLRDELLEQEFVQSSMPIKDKHFSIMIVLMALFYIYSFINGSWLSVAMGVYFFGCCILLLPKVSFFRERLPFIRIENRSLLVGLGWVNSHKRKYTWTVADSIILLRIKKNKPLETLHVRLLGPAKDFNFMFESVRDPEFIRLWQRWMHPNPRLELMEQETELSLSASL